MSTKHLRDASEWALLVAFVLGIGAIAQAQEDKAQPEGRLVQIGPGDAPSATASTDAATTDIVPPQTLQATLPKYWIGLLGGPVTPELRAQLDLPQDQGVMIRDIVADSPAAKAGLQTYDVLLAANDTPLHDMGDLAKLVRTQGESQGPIKLEVLRHGKVETTSVTPAERPEQLAQHGYRMGPGLGMPSQMMRQFAQQFGQTPGGAMQFHSFGPRVSCGGQSSALADMPNGISVSIQRENDQPPHITVKRGNDTWDIVGDDPGSLNQLPDDVRPFVEQLLHGSMHFGFQGMPMPGAGPMMPQVVPPPAFQGQDLQERIEAMERQIEALQQQMMGPVDENTQ